MTMALLDINMAADREFVSLDRAIEVVNANPHADALLSDKALRVKAPGLHLTLNISRDRLVDGRALRRHGFNV